MESVNTTLEVVKSLIQVEINIAAKQQLISINPYNIDQGKFFKGKIAGYKQILKKLEELK